MSTENKKSFTNNPLAQILVFAVVLIVLQVLSINGYISAAFTYALGNTLIYAIIAIGFCLLLGYSGLASLGTAGFIGLGAYIGYYIIQEFGMPFILALIITVAVALIIGSLVGFISLPWSSGQSAWAIPKLNWIISCPPAPPASASTTVTPSTP